jgi:uncharacterized Zn finger protein (UPF0148 family)
LASGDEEMTKKCKKCGKEMYQDDQGQWFCPDCILEEIDPAFLDEEQDDRGELERPYVERVAEIDDRGHAFLSERSCSAT